MAHYQCPLQLEVERLQQIANSLKEKAIQEYLNKGWQECYSNHCVINGDLTHTCILLDTNTIINSLANQLIKEGHETKSHDLIDFKKYLKYQLGDDLYIIF